MQSERVDIMEFIVCVIVGTESINSYTSFHFPNRFIFCSFPYYYVYIKCYHEYVIILSVKWMS